MTPPLDCRLDSHDEACRIIQLVPARPGWRSVYDVDENDGKPMICAIDFFGLFQCGAVQALEIDLLDGDWHAVNESGNFAGLLAPGDLEVEAVKRVEHLRAMQEKYGK